MSEEPASEGDEGGPATGVADLVERVDALAEAVDDLDADLEEKIEDVRARVIQVKREADAKAPADHDHPELAGAGEGLEGELADVRAQQERVAETVETLEDRLEAGFANYEEVLEYLVDTTDQTNERLGRVVDAVGGLRERVGRLEARRAEREAADRLRARAQIQGVASAKCEDCGGGVQLGLLTAARCPHCEASLADVEARGFLRSAVLLTGSRPALADPGTDDAPPLDDVEADSERSRPLVEGLSAADDPDRPTGASEDGDDGATDEPDRDPSSRPIEAVPGIGSTYAEQLEAAGVGTVDDLAAADPDELAERTAIAPGRVGTWVERARELDRPG